MGTPMLSWLMAPRFLVDLCVTTKMEQLLVTAMRQALLLYQFHAVHPSAL